MLQVASWQLISTQAAGSEARRAGRAVHLTRARAAAPEWHRWPSRKRGSPACSPGSSPTPCYLQLCLSPWIHAVHPRFSESKSRFGREEGLPGVAQPHCQSGGGGQGKSCPESEGP